MEEGWKGRTEERRDEGRDSIPDKNGEKCVKVPGT